MSRISVIIKGHKEGNRFVSAYELAERIVRDYQETSGYLKSIIGNHVPDGARIADSYDFATLVSYGKRIKAVAEKILASKPTIPRSTRDAIFGNIRMLRKLRKTSDIDKRIELEERICIQLEGCGVPDGHYLVKRFDKARGQRA